MIHTLLAHAATPICWLLMLAVAWTLADTAMFLLADAPVAGSAVQPQDTGRPRQPADLARIQAAHLFGQAVDPTAPEERARQAPTVETRLPLVLLGVFAGESADQSAAIIANRGEDGQLYRIGDTLPGNASLISVHSGHVVLARAGRREALTFPEARQQIVRVGAAAPHSSERPVPVLHAHQGGAAADQSALVDPGSLIDAYAGRPDAVVEALAEAGLRGTEAGYRVEDAAELPWLQQVGLKPGDLLLSVNGVPATTLAQDPEALRSIANAGEARVEVQRGERHFFVTASIDG